MNIDQLRALAAIAETGTFTQAADRLHLTQPALTQQIHQLEASLGEALFAPAGRKRQLTAAGRLVLDHARGILGGLDRLAADLAAHRDLCRGSLTLAAGDSLIRHVLLEPLGEFRRRHPGIAIHLRNRTSAETLELIRSGQADLGVVSLPLQADDLLVLPWQTYAWQAILPAGSTALPEPATPAWLAGQDLVLLEPGTHLRTVVDHGLAQEGLTARRVLEAGSTDLQLDMAALGLGVAVVPDYAAGTCPLARLSLPWLGSGTLGLVSPAQGSSAASRAFAGLLAARQA